jgi:hypothetical protein
VGAEQPQVRKTSVKTKTSLLPLLTGVATFSIALLILTKAVFNGESEAPKLRPKESAKLHKRLQEIDDSEQYALIAKMNGFYPCLHSGRTSCYLLAGEVWKYGVTSKGQHGRYAALFLLKNNVSYIVEFEGNIAECLKMEQIKLFNYQFLPENLARPLEERLPRPPFNPIMR